MTTDIERGIWEQLRYIAQNTKEIAIKLEEILIELRFLRATQ